MSASIEEKIASKGAVIGILGLGYVGLSLMEAFGKNGFKVIGYDRNKHKIESLHEGKEYLSGLYLEKVFPLLTSGYCKASDDPASLSEADVFIITVPTSLDSHKLPDLSKVKSAAHTIMKHLRKGCAVVMQSTSYPGTTDTEVLCILKQSHLKEGIDFHLSFIPEISDFGNTKFDFAKIPKIVGGHTPKCAEVVKKLYQHITDDVTIVSSTRVAEAAKILQNTYRLINISLINEMKMMFDKMGIDIWEVIDAAAKKPFGFTPFYPGPGIGGDCIPVDPYYLVWKAKETSAPTRLIELAAEVNEQMTDFVLHKIIHALGLEDKTAQQGKVLILGAAFKKDVNDIRESSSIKIIYQLMKEHIPLSYHDPFVPQLTPSSRYPELMLKSVMWDKIHLADFDCVVILTDHSSYDWRYIGTMARRIVDTRNVMAPYKEYNHKVVKA